MMEAQHVAAHYSRVYAPIARPSYEHVTKEGIREVMPRYTRVHVVEKLTGTPWIISDKEGVQGDGTTRHYKKSAKKRTA